jgi:ParB family chromosome partitioning protein
MIAVQSHADSDSNDRFEIALRTGDPDAPARTLSKHTDADVPDKPRASRRTIMAPVSGVAIARVLLGSDKVVLTLPRDSGGGFEDWLVDHLSDIHRTWVNSRSDETPEK